MLTPFERGLIAHLIGDWLLQNDWMSRNKTNLRHPAPWAHAAIYAGSLSLALGWQAGLVLGALHLLVDTRVPLNWWQNAIGQTREGPVAIILKLWADQVIHIALMAAWIEITAL